MRKNEKSFEDLPLSDVAFDALFTTPQVHSEDKPDADDVEPTEEDAEDQK